MIPTTRLLATVSVVSAAVSRNIHTATFQQKFKIIQTKDATLRVLTTKKRQKFPSTSPSPDPSYSATSMPNLEYRSVKKIRIAELFDASDAQKKSISDTYNKTDQSKIKLATLEEDLVAKVTNGMTLDRQDNDNDTMGKFSMTKERYEAIRPWVPVGSDTENINSDTHFVLKILSYNILAQNLLETHAYLYYQHNKNALIWENRSPLVHEEIMKAEANVICLQEVLDDHLEEFLVAFREAGYKYIYKKRTNDKKDGLLLLYRADQLRLEDHVELDLYRPNIDILNRDNVALVAKFSLIGSPETRVVVSTTHLLFNPKREDIRLAQTQLLLAEIERLAFVELINLRPRYLPVILCGDFNLQPHSAVYKFITEGSIDFKSCNRFLVPSFFRRLGNSLIPPSLLVTDNCESYDALVKRWREEDSAFGKTDETSSSNESDSSDEYQSKVDTRTLDHQRVKIAEGKHVEFSSGSLTHPLKLTSVYCHENVMGEKEVTTHQDEWITVDYIFYSDVEPIAKYNLPTMSECRKFPTIPNSAVGSDHLCLGASFKLKKNKR